VSETAPDGLPQPQQFWAIFTTGLGLIMAVLDGTIANIALPTIARDLAVTPASAVWVITSYQLAVTMSLLPLAALGEIFGFRRVYLCGLAFFTVASLACASAHTLPMLIAARVAQGVGAAGIMSVNAALLRFIYPRRTLGRGFGINAMIGSSTGALGPSVAAAVLSVAPWEYLFALNVPFGIAGALLGWRMLPHTPRAGHKFDVISAILNALAFGGLVLGVDGVGREGQEWAFLELAVAAIAFVLLVHRQLARTNPLLPIDLMRRPVFALSVVASICSFAAQGMIWVSMPFFLEEVRHFTRGQTGLLMTPWPLTVAFVAPIAGRLSDRFSPARVGGTGQAVMFLGIIALIFLPADASMANIAWRMSLAGIGFGLFNSPNNRTIVTSAPAHRSGGASGMQATSRLLGQTIGTATVGLLFGLIGTGALKISLPIAACFCVAAGLASIARPPSASLPPASTPPPLRSR
jgi:DHA2 family multidrug resistance protein-like MFS transporter